MQTDERFLIAFAQAGDADADSAFSELIAPYVGRLRFWLQGQFSTLRNDPPFADAIEARAFEDAKAGIKRFQYRSSFSTWLHAIARNRACTELARRNRDAPIDRRDFEAIAATLAADQGDRVAALELIERAAYQWNAEPYKHGDPINKLMRRERRRLEREAIDRLTKAERAVYVRRRFRQMEHPDIARELYISAEAVRRRFSDALSKVRAYIQQRESPAGRLYAIDAH